MNKNINWNARPTDSVTCPHARARFLIKKSLHVLNCLWLRWLATNGKNNEKSFKPQFYGVKFNADSKNEKKKWVSRARFRDNQHWMDAYLRFFESKIASPEVNRKEIYKSRDNSSTTTTIAQILDYSVFYVML